MSYKYVILSVLLIFFIMIYCREFFYFRPNKKIKNINTYNNYNNKTYNGINYILFEKNKLIKNDKIILFSHGNYGNISYTFNTVKKIQMILPDFDIIVYDYYGYGNSDNKTSVYNCKLSSVNIFNLILQKKYKNIILWGESIGGGINAELYNIIPSKYKKLIIGIVNQESFSCISKMVKFKFNHFFYNIFNNFIDEFNTIDIYYNKLSCPLLIIHSENDKLIPISEAFDLINKLKNKNNIFFIKLNGEHVAFNIDNTHINTILQWLNSLQFN